MPRLRCTLEEAKQEAIRLATEFVQSRPDAESRRFYNARPLKSNSGKIPANWSVMFALHFPGSTCDGGELFVRVNVQVKTVEEYEFWETPLD